MGDTSFLDKLALFKKNEENGKKRAGEFGQGLPVGNYLGRMQSLTAGKGQSSGRLQIHRELLVVEGEHANEVAHDWMNLEHEVGISIVTRFIEAHGYEMPSIIDEEKSKEEGEMVYAQDFLDVLQAIVDAAPTYRFRIRASGEYRNTDVLEITERGALDEAPAGATDDSAIGSGETGTDEAAEGEAAVEGTDPLRDKAVEFCLAVGLDAADSDDLDALKAKIAECAFPLEGVTAAQLKALGFEQDDGIRYNADQAAVLEELGLGKTVIKPQAPKPAPKPAPAAPAKKPAPKPVAKAPAKPAPKKKR